MSIPKIAKAMNYIDDDLISGAIEYKRTNKKSTYVKWGAIVACLCLAIVATEIALPKLTNNDIDMGKELSSKAETEKNTKVYIVKHLSSGENCEFAADMYRPEGYNENIGSTLALMMSIHENEDFKFSVLMRIPRNSDLEETLKKVHDIAGIDISEPVCVKIEGQENTINQYYCLLTAKQIVALSENGTKCFYIGSGLGNYEDIDWETKKGIEAYCELNGDMYVSCDGKTEHLPDIEIETEP